MMNRVDMMYQLYPPYFSHKAPSNEVSKFGSSGFYDYHQHSTGSSTIPNPTPYGHLGPGSTGSSERDTDPENDVDMELQPKSSQYVNQNCVLLSYFSGDTASVVDEHFTRALSQPSSFTIDRATNPGIRGKTDKPLMCHRKLPPSFWNSSYKPAGALPGGSLDYSRDPYFSPSWYSLQNNWPYRLPTHGHSDLGQGLSYSSLESTGKLGNPYQSLVFPGSYDSRSSKFDFSKNMESLAGSSSYYGLSRLTGMDFPSKSNIESTVSGLEYQLQSAARRELCW